MTDRHADQLRPVAPPARSSVGSPAWPVSPMSPDGHVDPPAVGGTPSIRARLLEAVIDVSAVMGFHGLAVGDLCELCRISRRTFYNHFAGIPELFLEAYVQMDAELRQAVWDAWKATDRDPDAVIHALVSFACADPVRADALFVQSLAAGDDVADRRLRTVAWCGSLLAGGVGDEDPTGNPGRLSLPYEMACGGAWAVIRARVSAGDLEGLTRDLEGLRRAVEDLSAAAVGCATSRYRLALPAVA